MPAICEFDDIKNKHDVCRGKSCMKRFCESLKEHAMKTILKKKKMVSLINKEFESYANQENCYICKIKFEDKYTDDQVKS